MLLRRLIASAIVIGLALILVPTAIAQQPIAHPDPSRPALKVGVFCGHGASQNSIEYAWQALLIDPGIEPRRGESQSPARVDGR